MILTAALTAALLAMAAPIAIAAPMATAVPMAIAVPRDGAAAMAAASQAGFTAPVLRVAYVAGQYPCSYQEKNIWKGSAIDLWGAVAEQTKTAFLVQRVATPKQAIASLVNGKIDVAVSCFNLTQERIRKVGYTTPYRFEGIKILGKAKDFDLIGLLSRAIKDARLPKAFLLLFGTTLIITIATVFLEGKATEEIFNEKLSPRSFARLWLLITIGPSPLDKTSKLNTATLLTFSHYVRIIFSGALIAAITAAAIGDSLESAGKFKIAGFADLEGLRIGVGDGSYTEALISQKLQAIQSNKPAAAHSTLIKYTRLEDLADALKHDQVDVIAGDASAIEALGAKLSKAGNYFIYAPELAKTPQGFLIAPTVSKAIDSALDDAVVSIEMDHFQEPKP